MSSSLGLYSGWSLTRPPSRLWRGDNVLFRAFGFDENGVAIPGLVFHWEVLDPLAGTVNSLGIFTAGDTPGEFPDAVQVTAIQRRRL